MGLSSSPDERCCHSDPVVKGLPWCLKIVDYFLIWASTPDELESPLHSILRRCEGLHATLSQTKFQIDTKVKFTGCIVSKDGVLSWCFAISLPFCAGLPAPYCVLVSARGQGRYLSLAPRTPAEFRQAQIYLNRRLREFFSRLSSLRLSKSTPRLSWYV